MDAEVGSNELKIVENLSLHPVALIKELKGSCGMKDKDAVELPRSSGTTPADSLGPITPDSNRENGECLHSCTSPLTLVSSPPKRLCFNSHWKNDHNSSKHSPRTPNDSVFDPFAPGPDFLMLAPHSKKYAEDSRTNVARRLNFESSANVGKSTNKKTDEQALSDEDILFQTVYFTLLEAIISNQTEGLLNEYLLQSSDSDASKTPTSAPRLAGVADSCPAAPKKPARMFRTIDKGLCRKLDF